VGCGHTAWCSRSQSTIVRAQQAQPGLGWAWLHSSARPPPAPEVIFGVGPRMKETWYLTDMEGSCPRVGEG
jgi:hypothetical protein